MLVSLEISMLIPFPKHGASLPIVMISSSSRLSPKPVTPSITNGDVTFPHSPLASRLMCFELSTFASMVKASCHCRKSVARKTLAASSVDSFNRTLTISFLTVLPVILYANLFLALKSALRRVAQLLGLCEVPLLLHL